MSMNASRNRSRLILASKSPRRSELLKQAGLTFSVIPSDFDEDTVALSNPDSDVVRLAESKALDISQKHPDAWVIGADTIVLVGRKILGKPAGAKEAFEMLQRLSGKTHRVLTGYCICCKKKNRIFSEAVKTDVRFKELTDAEINWYIQTGEPFDKAGGYAIQGIGSFLVRGINGSYTNVVGLPVCEVMAFLIKENVLVLDP